MRRASLARAWVAVTLVFPVTRVALGAEDQRIKALLEKHCGACHMDDAAGGLDRITDLSSLAPRGYLRPGAPESSKLFRRITSASRRMPPPNDAAGRPLGGLSRDEIASVRDWIKRGGDATTVAAVVTPGYRDGTAIQLVAEDLASVKKGGDDASAVRYLIFDGASAELDYHKAIADLVFNALSGADEVRRTVSVGPSPRLVRVSLPQYAWTATQFDETARASQSGWLDRPRRERLSRDRELSPYLDEVLRLTGSDTPVVLGGPFLAGVVCTDAAYRRHLGSALTKRITGADVSPAGQAALESLLGYLDLLGVRADYASGRFRRIVTKRSGVALNDRSIDLVPLSLLKERDAYFWITNDFDADRRIDLFLDGAPPTPNGHEVIFDLPNGFLGFLASQSQPDFRLVGEVPTSFARDTRRRGALSERLEVIKNPTSCFGCHAAGMLPKDDEKAVFLSRRGHTSSHEALLGADEGKEIVEAQHRRLAKAVAEATGAEGKYDLHSIETFCLRGGGR